MEWRKQSAIDGKYGPQDLANDVAALQNHLREEDRCKRQNITQIGTLAIKNPGYIEFLAAAMGTTVERLKQGSFVPGDVSAQTSAPSTLVQQAKPEPSLRELVAGLTTYLARVSAVKRELAGETLIKIAAHPEEAADLTEFLESLLGELPAESAKRSAGK